jgi:putative sigma-54 modulation protein
VILKLENTESRENKMVEIRLIVRGYDLFAKKQAKSFEEATDQAMEALKKQLIRHKEKIRGI